MKYLINIARIIVGILFIFSGLIKANDPLGLSYKMQEFFEVWGWHFPDTYTLVFSIALIAFEIIAGVSVLVGWQMRLFSWLLLLLMIFFTFLTGYAVLSGKVKECGCFGDCIPLTAEQSFIKDLILMALILPIFFYRKHIRPSLNPLGSMLILFFATVFSFAFQWYVLQHLPVVDCLPYKKGNSITEKMKIPADAIPDSSVITFVYDKAGRQVEFTAENFPPDYNDSLYKFVKRYDKLVRKGNAEPAIKDFSLISPDGQHITDSVLNEEGYKLFLFIKDEVSEGDWRTVFDVIMLNAASKKINGYVVTNMPLEELIQQAPPGFRSCIPLRNDVTAIKTAARTNPTLYLLKKDVIINKWGYADFESALKEIERLQ